MDNKKDLERIKNEIILLKDNLNKLDSEKEKSFKLKDELKDQVKSMVDTMKSLKKERDNFNIKLQELKKQRDIHNNKVRELITKIKELNKEKNEILKKTGIKKDPSFIKKRIQELETKIETEAISFDRERKIMEEIKKLKNIYKESSIILEVIEKIDNTSKLIEEEKKKADEAHQEIMKILKDNKIGYKEFINLSKQIYEVKTKQANAYQVFVGLKNRFYDINRVLKQRLFDTNKIKDKITDNHKKKQDLKKEREKKMIEEKAKQVEEKIKKVKKLTTEDLLILQGKEKL